MTTAMVCYVLLGTPAGYISARLYKMFGGERWAMNVLMSALLCPGLVSKLETASPHSNIQTQYT